MRKRGLLVLAMATLLLGGMAVPASAEPEEVLEPVINIVLDLENGVAVFWNTTRDNFCDWEAGGFQGDEPAEELIPALIGERESGVVRAMYEGTAHIELWTLDDDVPPAIGPCGDTDDQTAPFATGEAYNKGYDNDLFGEILRNNLWGNRGDGTVYDAAGDAWSYSWEIQFRDRGGEFSVVSEEYNLEKL